jgi:hypothetical protein
VAELARHVGSTMSRNRRVAIVAGLAILVLAAQVVNTHQVRKELCSRLSHAGECDTRTGLVSVETPLVNRQAEVGVEPLRLVVSTALLRKNCDDGWTVGWGGRGETAKIGFANATGALTVGRACIDLGRTRVSGHATDARLSVNRCAIHLSPLRFAFDGALQASVTATLDPSTVEDCGKLLPQSATALSGTVAGARAVLNVRYELGAGRSMDSLRSSATNDGAPSGTTHDGAPSSKTNDGGAGFARRVVSTMRTSHVLEASLGGERASLRLDTEPAGDSAAVTLSVHADAAMAALFPDLRPSAGAPLKLEVHWDLDHQTGTVRVNGEEIRRVPLAATRAAGRVDLPAAECNAAGRSLFFVEADDTGRPLRPAQLDSALTAVDGAVASAGAMVVVFVHGWHHSAAPGDAYVCRLSDVLASVEQMERGAAALARRPARDVMGIYVGWAGSLYPSELANSVTTFWNRLVAADHLGASDGVLRRLLAGLSQRLAGARTGAQADRRSSLLVVGHSMGARAVFNALRDDLLRTDAVPASLQADLGLLVNPAFSATLFRAVHQQGRDCRQGATPLLLFSSETDGVTRQLYPAGQTVTYPFTEAEPVPFLEHIYTAANFDEFVTHRLTLDPMNGDPPDVDGPQTILRGFERTPAGSKELYQDNPVTVYRQPTTGRPSAADARYRMHLVEVGSRAPSCDAAAGTSKVIGVDPRILPDHGRIFTPPFVEYVVRVLNRRALDSSAVR